MREAEPPKTRELFLLKLSDHAASATSRGLPPGVTKIPSSTTTRAVWNPGSVRPLQRIDQPKKLKELFDWLATDPTEEDFYARFKTELLNTPEDLYAPLNVVSLGTHVRLVSRFYHFFEKYVRQVSTSPLMLELEGIQASRVEDAERLWRLRVIQGEVLFAQEPARVRDLNIFEEVEAALLDLAQQTEILVTSSYQFLAVLPVLNDSSREQQMLNDLLSPVLQRGLYVHALEARIPVDTKATGEEAIDFYANPLPSGLKSRAVRNIERRFEGLRRGIQRAKDIPPDVRAKREQEYQEKQAQSIAELDSTFPLHGVYPSLPRTFGAAICEVCQMEQATVEWPKQDILDRGELCPKCAPRVQVTNWPPP